MLRQRALLLSFTAAIAVVTLALAPGLLAKPTEIQVTTIRVKDADGRVLATLSVPLVGSVEVVSPPGVPTPVIVPTPQPPPLPTPPPVVPVPAPPPVEPPAPVVPPVTPPKPPPPAPPIVSTEPVAFAIVITDKRQAIAVGQAAALQAGSTLKASVEAKGIGFAQFDALSAAVQNTPADKVPGGDYKQWLGNPKFKLAPALGTPCLVLVDKGGHPVKALPLPPDAPSILAAILN